MKKLKIKLKNIFKKKKTIFNSMNIIKRDTINYLYNKKIFNLENLKTEDILRIKEQLSKSIFESPDNKILKKDIKILTKYFNKHNVYKLEDINNNKILKTLGKYGFQLFIIQKNNYAVFKFYSEIKFCDFIIPIFKEKVSEVVVNQKELNERKKLLDEYMKFGINFNELCKHFEIMLK
jgi:hypothetical protein